MVDEFNIDDINSAEEALKRQSAATDDLARAQIELAQAVSRSTGAYDEYRRRIGESTENINKQHAGLMSTSEAATRASDSFENMADKKSGMDLLGRAVGVTTDMVNKLGAENLAFLGIASGVLPKVTGMFGELGAAAKKAGFDMAEAFGRVSPILEKLPAIKNLVPGMRNLAESASEMQELEFSLIRNSAAAGDLNRVIRSTGEDFNKLDDVTARYMDSLIQSAEATGVLVSQISPYANMLQRIPGTLGTVIELNNKFGKEMNMANATFKVGTALGMDHTEMYELLNSAWRTANLRGQDALEMIANIGQTAQDLNLPLDTVQQRVLQTAEAFKMWGDQTQSAINVLGDVRGALEDSGIGPEAIDQIVGSMVQGVQNLDMAQKAFISGATGGPGGLFGAFDIDRTLREEGGASKVLNQVMEAMQNQFGGPVVTHEDVMRTPALSGEFFKQMTFLKDVAGIAGSDIEAQRILEVMKKGGVGADELEFAKQPENILQDTIERGEQFAQKQRNQMTEHLRNIEVATMLGSQKTIDLLRVGQEDLNKQDRIADANEESARAGKVFEGREDFGKRDFVTRRGDEFSGAITDAVKFVKEQVADPDEVKKRSAGIVEQVKGLTTAALETKLEETIGSERFAAIMERFKETGANLQQQISRMRSVLINEMSANPAINAMAQTLIGEPTTEEPAEETGLASELGLAPKQQNETTNRLASNLGLTSNTGIRPQPLGVAPDVGEITVRGGVTERAEAARKETEMGAATAPLPPELREGTLKIEVDIKDGITTIAKATVTEELKKIWGPKATVGTSGTD